MKIIILLLLAILFISSCGMRLKQNKGDTNNSAVANLATYLKDAEELTANQKEYAENVCDLLKYKRENLFNVNLVKKYNLSLSGVDCAGERAFTPQNFESTLMQKIPQEGEMELSTTGNTGFTNNLREVFTDKSELFEEFCSQNFDEKIYNQIQLGDYVKYAYEFSKESDYFIVDVYYSEYRSGRFFTTEKENLRLHGGAKGIVVKRVYNKFQENCHNYQRTLFVNNPGSLL